MVLFFIFKVHVHISKECKVCNQQAIVEREGEICCVHVVWCLVCMCENEIYRCFILFQFIRRTTLHIFLSMMRPKCGRGCCCYMRSDDVYALQISLTYAANTTEWQLNFKRLVLWVCFFFYLLSFIPGPTECVTNCLRFKWFTARWSNVRASPFGDVRWPEWMCEPEWLLTKETEMKAFQTDDKAKPITRFKNEGSQPFYIEEFMNMCVCFFFLFLYHYL